MSQRLCKKPLVVLHGSVYHVCMTPSKRGENAPKGKWDAYKVRALRRHLGLTQQEMAHELGTRQQTISEWELGMYQPRGTSARLLGMVAERAGFGYTTGPAKETRPDGESSTGTAHQRDTIDKG